MNGIQVTIERTRGELEKSTWVFWLRPEKEQIALTFFAISKRSTKRHKFQVEESYNTYDKRGRSLEANQIPIPKDVEREAMEMVLETIRNYRIEVM
jgi:ketosteroid isomerase-like protein